MHHLKCTIFTPNFHRG